MFPVAKHKDLYTVWIFTIKMSIEINFHYPLAKRKKLAKRKLHDFMIKVNVKASPFAGLEGSEELRLVKCIHFTAKIFLI